MADSFTEEEIKKFWDKIPKDEPYNPFKYLEKVEGEPGYDWGSPQKKSREYPEMPAMPYMGAWGDYMAWQRGQMETIMKQYREQFPKFLRGWKEDKYSDLGEATESFYETARTGIEKRGLGESQGFVAGAKLDTTEFQEKGGRDIEAQAGQMEIGSLSNLLSTLGQPDFGGLAQGQMNFENLTNQQNMMKWQQDMMTDMFKEQQDPTNQTRWPTSL